MVAICSPLSAPKSSGLGATTPNGRVPNGRAPGGALLDSIVLDDSTRPEPTATGECARTGAQAAAIARPIASRTYLRVVAPPHDPGVRLPVAGIAVAVAAVLGLMLAVRALQGEPPAASWAGPEAGPRESVVALAGSGDLLRTAQPGDTFWSIAEELAPEGADVRPIVDRLVAANGGASIIAGQQLLIPAEVVDGRE